MEKSALLDRLGAAGEDRLLLANIWDRARQAQSRNRPVATDFLSPQQQRMTADLLRLTGTAETTYRFWGGYEGAERCVTLFLPDWMESEHAESPIRCLRAVFRTEDRLTHRDILGSLMGLGIVREKLGDILVRETSADLMVLESVSDFLVQNWMSAGHARLRVQEIDPAHVHIPAARYQEIRDTVHSLRLDAVAAAGFRMARGKMADLIAAGRVQLNWQACLKPDKLLSQGDRISARGLGKMELLDVGGITRKGRISIVIRRYI